MLDKFLITSLFLTWFIFEPWHGKVNGYLVYSGKSLVSTEIPEMYNFGTRCLGFEIRAGIIYGGLVSPSQI
ncbi:hypothetical protein CLU79DRAFT_734589 [Phycomyces nitens]|nr:hypothetical protein CLU79DRAFT_734589 [Phycomyces nitens]